MRALRYVQDVTMVNIPALKKLILRFAFVGVSELEMENASLLESYKELGELKRKQDEEKEKERLRREEEERKRKEQELKEKKERRENGIVLNAEDLESLSVELKSIDVKKCEDYQNEVLDLSRFVDLKEIKIGDYCFNFVKEVIIVGLKRLETITFGSNSFQTTQRIVIEGRSVEVN